MSLPSIAAWCKKFGHEIEDWYPGRTWARVCFNCKEIFEPDLVRIAEWRANGGKGPEVD